MDERRAGSHAEDSIGQVYFASALGVQVCEANGRVAAILNPPEPGAIAALAFAGKDMNWLYVAEGGKLFPPCRQSERRAGVGAGETAASAALMRRSITV